LAIEGRNIAVGDDNASVAKGEPGAFTADTGEESSADLDIIVAAAERNLNDAHMPRIGLRTAVSKVCRVRELALLLLG
jgi:hypothetical protein